MTINEITLNGPKVLVNSYVSFCFFKSKLFPISVRFSAVILFSWWIPVSEWVLGIRNPFLVILLNHLPQEIHILCLSGISGLLLHSFFWGVSLMRPTFPILQYQQSDCLPSKFTPR